jgi:Ca-activated chloride channel family protein
MHFLAPEWLWTLLFVPLLVAGYYALLWRRARQQVDLGTMGLTQTQRGRPIGRRRHVPAVLFLIGVTILFVALARPELELDHPRREGTVVLAFDVSASMRADDLAPTRMQAAKRAARTFVSNQPSSIRIGVVSFSTASFVVQPPTRVKGDVLDAIHRLAPNGGTSVGQGILASLNAIAGEPIPVDAEALAAGAQQPAVKFLGSSAVVMLTDGEDTSRLDPLAVAQIAAQSGVRIYPIGVGSAAGTVVEIEGFSVSTRLDEELLREVAKITNGTYFRAENAAQLSRIYDGIDLQLTTQGEMTEVTSIFAGVALLFLLAGGALSMLWLGRAP